MRFLPDSENSSSGSRNWFACGPQMNRTGPSSGMLNAPLGLRASQRVQHTRTYEDLPDLSEEDIDDHAPEQQDEVICSLVSAVSSYPAGITPSIAMEGSRSCQLTCYARCHLEYTRQTTLGVSR